MVKIPLSLMDTLWERMDEATALDLVLGYYGQGAKAYPANMFYAIEESMNVDITSPTIKLGSTEYEFWELYDWFEGWSVKRSKNALFKGLCAWIREPQMAHSPVMIVTKLVKLLINILTRFITFAKDWFIEEVKMEVVNAFNDPLRECLENVLYWADNYPQITIDWMKIVRIVYQTHVREQERIKKESER